MSDNKISLFSKSLGIEKKAPKKEVKLTDSQVAITQSKIAFAQETVTGVIGLVADLIEAKKISDQGKHQVTLLQEQGELIKKDLEAFIHKNGLERGSFREKASAMQFLLNELNTQLNQQDFSNELKIQLVNLYQSFLPELLKK